MAEIRDTARMATVLARVARAVDKRVKRLIRRRLARVARVRSLACAWARARPSARADVCTRTGARGRVRARPCPRHCRHARRSLVVQRFFWGEGAVRMERAVDKGRTQHGR